MSTTADDAVRAEAPDAPDPVPEPEPAVEPEPAAAPESTLAPAPPEVTAAPVAPEVTEVPEAPAVRPSTVGRRGRYRVDEVLGRGGASAVHRGWDRLLHRPVALKLLNYDVQPQPDDRHREARVVAGLDHPGLVPVYDVSRLEGHDAVVMQLVDGPSLAERLRTTGPLSLAEALDLGAEIAGGLAHTHAHDVVHRDVKPANILLSPGGARLTDFGIARAPGATTLTGEGVILGTAAYLAPEQVRHGDASPAVDVFALGLVLLECLTGLPCYPSSPTECAARLETVAEVPEHLPERVREALAGLTALDPARRPSAAAAGAALAALATTLEQEGAVALDRPSPAARRSSPVPFATAVVGLLLAAATVVAVLTLLAGRPDVGVPVLVAAAVAQGAVLWNGRRVARADPAPREPGRVETPAEPHDAPPPAPAGP